MIDTWWDNRRRWEEMRWRLIWISAASAPKTAARTNARRKIASAKSIIRPHFTSTVSTLAHHHLSHFFWRFSHLTGWPFDGLIIWRFDFWTLWSLTLWLFDALTIWRLYHLTVWWFDGLITWPVSLRWLDLCLLGAPYVRPMGNVAAVGGRRLLVACPVAGYPIDGITWHKGHLLSSPNTSYK